MSKNRPHARRAARSRAFQVLYSLQFSPSTTLGGCPHRVPRNARSHGCGHGRKRRNPRGKAVRLRVGTGGGRLVQRQKSRQRHRTLLAELARGSARQDRADPAPSRRFRNAVPADVPPKVAINEALELSTRFGDAKAKSFINGILDAAIKAQEAGTLTVAGKADA